MGLLLLAGCPAAVETSGEGTDDSSSGAETTASGSTDSTSAGTTVSASTSEPGTDATADGVTTDATTSFESTGGDERSTGGSSSGGTEACAMDLLFVVDNSGSMEPRLALFLEALPQLVEGLDGIDLRAMVVDIDADPFVACEPVCDTECYVDGVCSQVNIDCFIACSTCPDYDCKAPPPPACDVTLGAGLVVEQGAGNAPCDFASGERWIDSSEPSFASALACAANVGSASTAGDELIMESAISALDSIGEASACNAGFLRPEAGLGVVVLTDEPDVASSGNADFWRLELETSQRDPERIAFAAIIGDEGLLGAQCSFDDNGFGADAPQIRALAEMFGDRGVVGSICAESYAPTLLEFSEVVAGMCG